MANVIEIIDIPLIDSGNYDIPSTHLHASRSFAILLSEYRARHYQFSNIMPLCTGFL